jgi:hypothetical protein
VQIATVSLSSAVEKDSPHTVPVSFGRERGERRESQEKNEKLCVLCGLSGKNCQTAPKREAAQIAPFGEIYAIVFL